MGLAAGQEVAGSSAMAAAAANVPSKALDLKALRQAVSAANRSALMDEFASVPSFKINPADLPSQYSSLNRYADVLPAHESRVPLRLRRNDPRTEYINGNFVTGYNGKKRFIATQGPTKATMSHYWAMLWEHDIEIIVMMTGLKENGRNKCEAYWPSQPGEVMEDEDFKLTSIDSTDADAYVLSRLELTEKQSGTSRQLHHFWYTSWPDHGVPSNTGSVLELAVNVRRLSAGKSNPVLVHCSAGIGRTGTYIAIDIGMDELQSEYRICDIYGAIHRIRKERPGSIQTFDQYLFVHQALLDFATPGKPSSLFGKQEPRDVGLVKTGAASFGFLLRGSAPPFVLKLDANGVAKKNKIRAGDHVLKVNQQDVSHMSHHEVVEIIRNAGNVITLTVISRENC